MEILYSDDCIAVAVKPVGMDSEHLFPQALGEKLSGKLYPIHRLDQNVGGVMVYARTEKAAAELSRAVQQGSMVKEYIAMVHGTLPPEGEWEDLLFKDSRRNKVFVVKKERKGVKKARLFYRAFSLGEQSAVHVRLYTGRSHQIRVQFSSRGFPLVGDHKYGSRSTQKLPMLYSCRISFPYAGKTVSFTRLPDWAAALGTEKLCEIGL